MGQFRAGQNGMGQGKMGCDSSEQDRLGWDMVKMGWDSPEQDRMGRDLVK